jgi:MYXO-CTERM domain-containing protein
MSPLKKLAFLAPLGALALASAPRPATACGACFHGESENTQVTGHRMVFSISPSETTLWDQISYTGDPSSWAWVLPVKGTVEIGLSSDALFEAMVQLTQVQVAPPPQNCPVPDCYNGYGGSDSGFGGAGGGTSGGVSVVAQSVVGPYETVQLHSTDPNALSTWLSGHGYVIQPDFAPTVSAYVAEGFDFLALKLVPGQGVTSMKPVRVTTHGAGATLPLRMVAAGVGALTPITLWVFGEGRYQPSNFPWFTISESQLVWDFATSSSNYKDLRAAGFAQSSGHAWLMETATPFSTYDLESSLQELVSYDPTNSGYGDAQGIGAPAELDADLAKLWGSLNQNSMWVSRMYAELSKPALAADLIIGAAPTQTALSANLTAQKGLNIPACPTYPPCDETGGAGGGGGAGGTQGSGSSCTAGCAVGGAEGSPEALLAAALLVGLALVRRRRQG